MKKEISDLAVQKQDALTCFHLEIYLMDAKKMEMACWKRLLDYFDEYVVIKNGNRSFISFLPLNLFIILVDVGKGDKKRIVCFGDNADAIFFLLVI
jgi:hypothetical protein